MVAWMVADRVATVSAIQCVIADTEIGTTM
jgi:hypothetical protein